MHYHHHFRLHPWRATPDRATPGDSNRPTDATETADAKVKLPPSVGDATEVPSPDTPAAPAIPRNAAEDLAVVAELRARGYSDEAIRGIMQALIRERFDPARTALQVEPDSADNSLALRRLALKESRALNAAMGGPWIGITAAELAHWTRIFGGLSLDTVAAIREVTDHYHHLKLEWESEGVTAEEMQRLEQQRRRDIHALLTPLQRVTYDRQTNPWWLAPGARPGR